MDERPFQSTRAGTRFYLPTLGYSVSAAAFRADARLCVLAAEDAAWSAAVADWTRRTPRRRQLLTRLRWRAEHEQLVAARQRIRLLARSLGLPVPG